jgi:queuine tRNA-ribosyltransferase
LLKFSVVGKNRKARAGFFETDHGIVETPVFMPVGTQGTVKAVNQKYLEEIKTQIVLSNTYHLYLRPGTEVLEKAGGLSELRKVKPDGVEFRSHLDGSAHFFSPKKVVAIQRSIGSDVMMVLDECTPYPCDYDYALNSAKLTSNWAEMSKEAFEKSHPLYEHKQFMFGIIQGSVYKDVRKLSAKDITKLDFDGYAIGGLAVGEPVDIMYEMVDFATSLMPEEKPRYLMGVGRPENLLEAVERGVDMFDCVMPTRNGRNAYLFTSNGVLSMRNAKYKDDFSEIDKNCNCYTCRNFSKAYLRHLFIAGEILALELASIHNLNFYLNLMRTAREKILEGRFLKWKKEILKSISSNNNITTEA